jgi:hypothetical protein
MYTEARNLESVGGSLLAVDPEVLALTSFVVVTGKQTEMFNRKSAVAIGGIIVGLVIAAASLKAWDNKTTSLTFTRPVALPGVTLNPRTHIFALVNPGTSVDLVRVSSQDRSKIYLTAFTQQIERPAGAEDLQVSFGEAAPNAALPISAWYQGRGRASGPWQWWRRLDQ